MEGEEGKEEFNEKISLVERLRSFMPARGFIKVSCKTRSSPEIWGLS
jgi:hypothetical protein